MSKHYDNPNQDKSNNDIQNTWEKTYSDEEPKYVICGEADKFYRCVNCDSLCGSEGHYIEDTTNIVISNESNEIHPDEIWNDKKMEAIAAAILKQEILKEDATKRYPNGMYTIMGIDYSKDLQLAYIEGFNASRTNIDNLLQELKLLKEELSYEKRKKQNLKENT